MDLEVANKDQISMDTIQLSPRELYMMLSHVEKMIIQRMNLEEKARSLQAGEYERRLLALNHAHDQAKEKERDFLTIAQYNVQHKELERRVEQNSLALVQLNTLPVRIDALFSWKDYIGGLSNTFTSSTVPQLEAVRVQVTNNQEKMVEIEKKLTSIYSYGAGATAVVVVLGVLINIVIRLLFKG
jgi:hypothetical protein